MAEARPLMSVALTLPRAGPPRRKPDPKRLKSRTPIWNSRSLPHNRLSRAGMGWFKDKGELWRSGGRSIAARSRAVSRDVQFCLTSKVVGAERKAPRPQHLGVLTAKIPDWDRRGSRSEPDVGRQEKLLPRA